MQTCLLLHQSRPSSVITQPHAHKLPTGRHTDTPPSTHPEPTAQSKQPHPGIHPRSAPSGPWQLRPSGLPGILRDTLFPHAKEIVKPRHSSLHTIWYLTLSIVITYLHTLSDCKSHEERAGWRCIECFGSSSQLGAGCGGPVSWMSLSPAQVPSSGGQKRATCSLTLLPLKRAVSVPFPSIRADRCHSCYF